MRPTVPHAAASSRGSVDLHDNLRAVNPASLRRSIGVHPRDPHAPALDGRVDSPRDSFEDPSSCPASSSTRPCSMEPQVAFDPFRLMITPTPRRARSLPRGRPRGS